MAGVCGCEVSRGYVITGTDTDVGKTIVAAGLAAALGAHYWKPIQAGLDGYEDSRVVVKLAGPTIRSILPEAYRLKTACSPHEAARIDGVAIDPAKLSLPDVDGPIIVEGAGGVMAPLSDRLLMLDLFEQWAMPMILVAKSRLGMISHSLLSIEALRSRGLHVAGVLFVGASNPASEVAITGIGAVPHLGRLPWLEPLTSDALEAAFARNIRLECLAS